MNSNFKTPKFDKMVAKARAKGLNVDVAILEASPESLSYGEKIASVDRRCLCVSSLLKGEGVAENYFRNMKFKI